MSDYALAIGCIFGVNLLPAFGPPTWAILVFFRLNSDLAAVPLILLGAAAAASGRLMLASASRRFRSRFSEARRQNLKAAEETLTGSRGKALAGLSLFALSPVPSAQLFVAAGLLTVPLVPLTLAFFAGRLVSYSLYVGAASAAKDNLASIFSEGIASPPGIALQLLMLTAIVLLVRIDWTKWLRPRHEEQASAQSRPPCRSSGARRRTAMTSSTAGQHQPVDERASHDRHSTPNRQRAAGTTPCTDPAPTGVAACRPVDPVHEH